MWSKIFSKSNKFLNPSPFGHVKEKKNRLFDLVVEKKILHRSWNADLHLPVTEETTTLIQNKLSSDNKKRVEIFISEVDGNHWYRIPFEYSPYWDSFMRAKDSI